MPESVQFELILPISPEAELVAFSTAERIASLAGFDEKTTSEVGLAVMEACINLFEHSHSRDKRVDLTFVLGESKLLIIVRDFGLTLEAIHLGAVRIREEMEKLRPSRWGLLTIVHQDSGA